MRAKKEVRRLSRMHTPPPLVGEDGRLLRCWDLKLEMGTVLEPQGAGMADARGRRAASPRLGRREKAKYNDHLVCVCFKTNQASFQYRCFFPLASVSAGRLSVSARKPRSGLLARGVC